MNKKIFIFIIILVTTWLICLTNQFNQRAVALTDTSPAAVAVSIGTFLNLVVSSGQTIDLGTLTPGTPQCNASGSVAGVTTNASNGYWIGLIDSSDTNTNMTKGGSVYIPDATGATLDSPAFWVTGNAGFLGLGATMFAADNNKEAKWGTGTTACDGYNKWGGISTNLWMAHTVTGYHAGLDTSTWGWKVDVPNTQASGSYSGDETFSSTAVFD